MRMLEIIGTSLNVLLILVLAACVFTVMTKPEENSALLAGPVLMAVFITPITLLVGAGGIVGALYWDKPYMAVSVANVATALLFWLAFFLLWYFEYIK